MSEVLPAGAAHVQSVSGVSILVLSKVGALAEASPALAACARVLPSVRGLVSDQVRSEWEASAAGLTRVGVLSRERCLQQEEAGARARASARVAARRGGPSGLDLPVCDCRLLGTSLPRRGAPKALPFQGSQQPPYPRFRDPPRLRLGGGGLHHGF